MWSKDDAIPARTIPSDSIPTPFEGLIWGTLPIGSSILAILFVFLLGEPRRVQREITVSRETPEGVYHDGVHS